MLPMIVALVAAIVLVIFQTGYGPGKFDYRRFEPHSGQLLLEPYPILFADRKAIPLVAPGKHGALPLFTGINGRSVSLNAARIHRESEEMLEVLPGSVHAAPGSTPLPPMESLGTYTLEGEVVDSKCFLGVMNPGAGRVHRDCAVRCISGGVPPIFVVRDRTGRTQLLYLTHTNRDLLEYIAEPVRIRGELLRQSNLRYFRIAGITRR